MVGDVKKITTEFQYFVNVLHILYATIALPWNEITFFLFNLMFTVPVPWKKKKKKKRKLCYGVSNLFLTVPND